MRHKYISSLWLFALLAGACGNDLSTEDFPAAKNSSTVDAVSLSDEALTQLAGEAFTFTYPLVEQYRMLVALTNPQSPVFSADFNQFGAVRALQGPEDTLIIRPNADTLYAGVILDVRAEPMVIGVPAIMNWPALLPVVRVPI